MIRMLRIIASMDPASGGPCQGIRNSIPALQELGVTTEVVCLDPTDASFLGSDEFKITALGPGKTPYVYSAALKPWLEQHLEGFDIAIIHGLWLYTSYGTYRTWKQLQRAGKPVPRLYIMPHGMLDPYFQKAPERRFKAMRNRVFWQLLEKQVINGVDGVLFTCEQELLLARTTFPGYHPKAELNVGYGIQEPPQQTALQQQAFLEHCPQAATKPYWLFLSRIHPKKGVELLLNAYRKIHGEHPYLPILVIAGPGMNSPYGAELRKLAKGLPVYFPGMLQGDAKWGALYGADWFILPSHQENFGIAVVEALACNTPVAISKPVNIWREISDAKGGLVFDDDLEGVISGLDQLLLMEDRLKQEYAHNARELYETRYRIAEAAAYLKQVLEQYE